MVKFIKTTEKIIICLALAFVMVFATLAAGCGGSNHPKAEIELELRDGEEVIASVKLKYTLYRNIRPKTVQHFIALADSGFYNETIIHDIGSFTSTASSGDWYTGAYKYDEALYTTYSEDDAMSNYFGETSKEREYLDKWAQLVEEKKIVPSVYGNHAFDKNGKEIVERKDALPAVMGEYSHNINQEIDNDVCTAQKGALKMFYYGKQTTKKVYVTPTDDQIIQADYKNNCATSLFMIQVGGSSNRSSSDYATFALLDNQDELDEFLEAVDEYLEDLTESTVRAQVTVDNLESFSDKSDTDNSIETNFLLPSVPLVVKTVKITKY